MMNSRICERADRTMAASTSWDSAVNEDNDWLEDGATPRVLEPSTDVSHDAASRERNFHALGFREGFLEAQAGPALVAGFHCGFLRGAAAGLFSGQAAGAASALGLLSPAQQALLLRNLPGSEKEDGCQDLNPSPSSSNQAGARQAERQHPASSSSHNAEGKPDLMFQSDTEAGNLELAMRRLAASDGPVIDALASAAESFWVPTGEGQAAEGAGQQEAELSSAKYACMAGLSPHREDKSSSHEMQGVDEANPAFSAQHSVSVDGSCVLAEVQAIHKGLWQAYGPKVGCRVSRPPQDWLATSHEEHCVTCKGGPH